MKKTIKVFGIIAIVAVIGFSFTACEDEPEGDKVTVNETSGRLTITGIPAQNNGKWIYGVGTPGLRAGNGIVHESGLTYHLKGVQIVDGSATLKVWKEREENIGSSSKNLILDNYIGNDNASFYLYIINVEAGGRTDIISGSINNVNFSNGIASSAF